jgi:thiol-disulfide isomerase/thioredoxin
MLFDMPVRDSSAWRLSVALAGTLLILTGCSLSPPSSDTADVEESLGWHQVDAFPVDFNLTDRLTGTTSEESLSDGLILVNVWASYCQPCRKELPVLEKTATRGAVTIVGISRDPQSGPPTTLLRDTGVTYSNWRDPLAKFIVQFADVIPLNAIPSSILVRDGTAVAVHIGEFSNESEISAGIDQYGRGAAKSR